MFSRILSGMHATPLVTGLVRWLVGLLVTLLLFRVCRAIFASLPLPNSERLRNSQSFFSQAKFFFLFFVSYFSRFLFLFFFCLT